MLTRINNMPKELDFFLFGPRSAGKTTILRETFSKNTVFFDLLSPDTFDQFQDNPKSFENALLALPPQTTHVIVDEIQKLPHLLDIVQKFIFEKKFTFGLTGSSARRLKRGHANLLGGRAVLRTLWPLTFLEYPQNYTWEEGLQWGDLPDVVLAKSQPERTDKLRTYVQTYLAEEIVAEQIVRNLSPFRKFLAVAAQMNGKIINTQKIGRDVSTSHNTVNSYFEILEDTLIGFRLGAYESSVRKRVRNKSKFFLFDTGVSRALSRALEYPVQPGTSYYGELFEHYVICQFYRLARYLKPDWELFYFQTSSGNEIDLIIDKGFGQELALVEIKSASDISKVTLTDEIKLMAEFKNATAYILSQDPVCKQITNQVKAIYWQEGIKEIFQLSSKSVAEHAKLR